MNRPQSATRAEGTLLDATIGTIDRTERSRTDLLSLIEGMEIVAVVLRRLLAREEKNLDVMRALNGTLDQERKRAA